MSWRLASRGLWAQHSASVEHEPREVAWPKGFDGVEGIEQGTGSDAWLGDRLAMRGKQGTGAADQAGCAQLGV